MIPRWMLAFPIAAAACSGDDTNKPADAGPDAPFNVSDAGPDSGFVYPEDSDSPVDAGFGNPFQGDWASIPGLKTGCALRYAVDAKQFVPAMAWTPCGSGCRELVTSWTQHDPRLSLRAIEPLRTVAGKTYIAYRREYTSEGGAAYAFMDVVQVVDGDPILGIGRVSHGDFCGLVASPGDLGVAMELSVADQADAIRYFSHFRYQGGTLRAVTYDPKTSLNDSNVANVVSSGNTFFLDLSAGLDVGVHDSVTRDTRLATPQLGAEKPLPVNDGAVVRNTAKPHALTLLKTDATHQPLLSPSATKIITAVAIDRSGGNGSFVWVETDDTSGGAAAMSIWTAPYNIAAPVKRKVKDLDDVLKRGGANMVANAGAALVLIDKDKARLTLLADGKGWTINAPEGKSFVRPVWVDNNEVWLAIGEAPDKGIRTIRRIERGGLGPAQ